jgi:hypothetical protein
VFQNRRPGLGLTRSFEGHADLPRLDAGFETRCKVLPQFGSYNGHSRTRAVFMLGFPSEQPVPRALISTPARACYDGRHHAGREALMYGMRAEVPGMTQAQYEQAMQQLRS